MQKSTDLSNVLKTAEVYTNGRISALSKGQSKFKITSSKLREELTVCSVFGELSCLERLMTVLVSDKSLTREDIEAELHLSIVDYYNFINQKFGSLYPKMDLEKYLEMRGYYKKDLK